MREQKRHSAPTGIIASALLLSLLAGCEPPEAAKTLRADTAKAAQAAGATRVIAVHPMRTTLRRIAEEPGQIEAFEVTPIHAKVAGFVRKLNVDIGSSLKAGQVMAEISMPELDAEVRQKQALIEQATAEHAQSLAAVEVAEAAVVSARAKVDETQAVVKRANADLAYAKSENERTSQLVRDQAQPPSMLDESRNRLRAAESSRDEVQAKIRSADAGLIESQAQLDKAKSDVAAAASRVEVARFEAERIKALQEYTLIRAPYDGIVIKRNIDTGHLTVPGGTSEPLFVVARSDLVTISVFVPEMFAVAADPGDRATIRLQALEGRKFEGKVTRTAWALDAKTRTVRVEIDVPNPDGTLRPGLYAYVAIVVDEHPDVLALPTSAVFKDGEKSYCVVVKNDRAERKAVELGLSDGKLVEVRKGLQAGEVVVKAYADNLTDGQALQVTEIEKVGAKP